MTHKHTEGPWGVSPKHAGIIKKFDCFGESNVIIGSSSGHPRSGFFPSEEEAVANAVLMAASPELLVALERMVTWHTAGGTTTFSGDHPIAVAQAVIAKATMIPLSVPATVFEPGDIVTICGTDHHRIESMDSCGDLRVVCVLGCEEHAYEVGDGHHLAASMLSLVRRKGTPA